MGLNRRNKPLKLLKFEDSILHPNSYYNLTALLQSGLLQGRVIFKGNVFVDQTPAGTASKASKLLTSKKEKEKARILAKIQESSMAESSMDFHLFAQLLNQNLQILDLNCSNIHIFGSERQKDNVLRVIFKGFCGY